MSADEQTLIRFVAAIAVTQFCEIEREDRLKLLAGLKLLLPQSEFEQCEILETAITDAERAKERADDAQLLLGEMFVEPTAGAART